MCLVPRCPEVPILKNLCFGNTSLKTYSILKIKTSIAKFTSTVPDCFWKQEKEQPEGKCPFPFLAGSWLLSLVLLCLKGQSHQSYMKQSSRIPITIRKKQALFFVPVSFRIYPYS